MALGILISACILVNGEVYISYFQQHSKAVLLMNFSVLFVLVSVSVLCSPSICLDDIVTRFR